MWNVDLIKSEFNDGGFPETQVRGDTGPVELLQVAVDLVLELLELTRPFLCESPAVEAFICSTVAFEENWRTPQGGHE